MQDFLNQLRDAISIVDVVQEKVSLTKKGREYMGLCPFHGEKTPSFYVNPQKGFYYCFGCGAKGNIFTFYQEIYGMSFAEALKALADKAGLIIPKKINLAEAFKEDTRKKMLIGISTTARDYYTKNLFSESGKKALDYLKKRGLSLDTIKQFNLGFSLNDSHNLWEALEKDGIHDEDILELGLKNHNQKGELYDFFRNRVIFPIADNLGKCIAFGGRGMGDEIPKYLNSKESYIFHKKNTLYNLHLALQNLKNDHLIMVEGYMDVIALYNGGFKTSVAGLGTSITEEHLKTINKYDTSPIFCLDGDVAGLKATARVIDLYLNILEVGMNPRFVLLENGEDPDSYILKNGKEKFQEELEKSQSLSQTLWFFATTNKDLSLPEVAMASLKELQESVHKIKDRQLRERFLTFFKNKIYSYGEIDNSILYKNQSQEQIYTTPSLDYNTQRDAILIACVLCYPEILDNVEERLGLAQFNDSTLNKLKDVLLANINGDTRSAIESMPNECNYVWNLAAVKLKLPSIISSTAAEGIFNESYNLILIENLLQEEQHTITKIKQLGEQLQHADSDKEHVAHKIQIFMQQKIEISKQIDTLKKGKIDG
ncbi:MAG: DNA primase [Alphaproteobacteria bacterium]|jgi:DNA primase|nr:DNA primase [Alphaproteobacteria bacterium]